MSFLSEWVYNNAVIILYAYICLALTKHVQSQSNSSAPSVYLISLYYNIRPFGGRFLLDKFYNTVSPKYGLVGINALFQVVTLLPNFHEIISFLENKADSNAHCLRGLAGNIFLLKGKR